MKLYRVCVDIGYDVLIWSDTPRKALNIAREERKGCIYMVYEIDLDAKPGIAKENLVHQNRKGFW